MWTKNRRTHNIITIAQTLIFSSYMKRNGNCVVIQNLSRTKISQMANISQNTTYTIWYASKHIHYKWKCLCRFHFKYSTKSVFSHWYSNSKQNINQSKMITNNKIQFLPRLYTTKYLSCKIYFQKKQWKYLIQWKKK